MTDYGILEIMKTEIDNNWGYDFDYGDGDTEYVIDSDDLEYIVPRVVECLGLDLQTHYNEVKSIIKQINSEYSSTVTDINDDYETIISLDDNDVESIINDIIFYFK